jgi:hypothetical protein
VPDYIAGREDIQGNQICEGLLRLKSMGSQLKELILVFLPKPRRKPEHQLHAFHFL